MWATANSRRVASFIIPKQSVKTKSAPSETALTGTEEVVSLDKHAKEEKAVNIPTVEEESTLMLKIFKPSLKV